MAQSATVGILRVLLSANTAEFQSAMAAAAKSADAVAKGFGSMATQATNVGSTLTKALTLPIAGIAVGAAKLAIDFESSFAGVRKTVNATSAEFASMAQGFRDLAKTIPVNVNELNKIGEAAGALGIRKENILEFTSVMAQLGVTTNLTSNQAATSIAQIQNIFNAAGKDTKNFASALVALGNDGASTETQIVDFAARLAGAGHQIGLTQQNVLGFSAGLANMGLNAELGGTALSKVMSKISVAVDTGGKKLEGFAKVAGMTGDAFKTLFKSDPAEAILRFTEGLGKAGISGQNLTIILNDLGLKGASIQDVLKRLAGGGDQLRTALDLASTAWRDNTALTKEAEQRFATTEQQMKLLWQRIQDVGITLGNALKPGIDAAIKGFDALIPMMETVANGFAALPGFVQAAGIGFAGLLAAAGPLLLVFGQLAGAAQNITVLFGKKGIATRLLAGELLGLGGAAAGTSGSVGLLASAFALLTNPITLAIAAAGAVGIAIYAIATAETDLEKAIKSNSAEFKRHTDGLDASLKTYTDLSAKQKLTADETSRLEVVTRELAKASGLSEDAFKREATSSSALTDELRRQISTRKELVTEATNQARKAVADAEAALKREQDQLNLVLDKKASKAETSGGTGGGGLFIRDLTDAERLAEIQRLNEAIGGLKKNVDTAKASYQALVGPLSSVQSALLDKTLGTSADQVKTGWEGVAGLFTDRVVPSVQQVGEATKQAGKDVSGLAKLNAQYAEDIEKIGVSGFKEIKAAHDQYGESVSKLAKEYDVAESSIDRYIGGTKDAAKATKEAAKEAQAATKSFDQFSKKADELDKMLTLAQRPIAEGGMPAAVMLEEFGSAIEDVTRKAPLFGKAVGDATKAAADALKKSDLAKATDKLITELNNDARKMVGEWQKVGEDAGGKLAGELAKSNKKWLDDAASVQKGLIGLEKDSLQKRLDLIKLEFDERRRALDKNGQFYQQQLEILNAEEKKALEDGTKTWVDEARKRRDAVTNALESLGQAFSQLAQVSGGSFAGIAKDIGELISTMNLARKAGESMGASIGQIGKEIGKLFGDGSVDWSKFASGMASAAASIVSAAAALMQATDPRGKSTAQTVLGGTLVGGQIGDSTGIPGAGLIGMGVGALVGWWRSAHAEWKKVAEDIGRDIGADISQGLAQQIADLEKTIVGGTKDQRRAWAEALSLDAIIAEQGGLTSANAAKFEKQATALFEPIIRGGQLGADATKELNTLVGQFAAQAEKTGGMWDRTFKDLIAQSKALGLNLDSITTAIDGQISKLSGGLTAAAKGAFAETDSAFDRLSKNLTPDQTASLTDPSKQAGAGLPPEAALNFAGIAEQAQPAFDRLSRTALAAFNTIIANGQSAVEAIAAIGPTIDTLIAQHDKLGLAGGAAFDQLSRFRTLTSQNADLVASVGGLNDVLLTLSNLGGLNADTLKDLEDQGLDTFGKLQQAGFTENESLSLMAPTLENIRKAHKDLGIPIDDNTQKLLDQAEAQGILKKDGDDMVSVLKEGFAALIKAVGGDLPDAFKTFTNSGVTAAGAVTGALAKIPKTIDIDVNANFKQGQLPEGSDSRYRTAAEQPTYAAAGDIVGRTLGRVINFKPNGTDTEPYMLSLGESVLNPRATQALGAEQIAKLNAGWNPFELPATAAMSSQLQRTGTDGGPASAAAPNIYVTVQGDVKEDSTPRRLALEIAREVHHGGTLRTQFRELVGID